MLSKLRSRSVGVGPKRGSVGDRGERAAARMLRRKGYRVIARNLRTTAGEADLVCLAPLRDAAVLVEVKTRRVSREAASHRPPETGLTAKKQQRLRSVARALATHPKLRALPVRIDLVAIDWPTDGRKPLAMRHYERAVGGG